MTVLVTRLREILEAVRRRSPAGGPTPPGDGDILYRGAEATVSSTTVTVGSGRYVVDDLTDVWTEPSGERTPLLRPAYLWHLAPPALLVWYLTGHDASTRMWIGYVCLTVLWVVLLSWCLRPHPTGLQVAVWGTLRGDPTRLGTVTLAEADDLRLAVLEAMRRQGRTPPR